MANISHDRQGALGSAAAVDVRERVGTRCRGTLKHSCASRATSVNLTAKVYGRTAVAGSCRLDNPRHPADLYETPPEAVEMLLKHVRIAGPVLEPSAGRSAIVKELRRHGLKVHASDLYDHKADLKLRIKTGVDFLKTTTLFGCRTIIMNSPFKDSEHHVRHALRLLLEDGTLAALLRMNWRAAKTRADLLSHVRLEVIAGRLKMLPPGAVDRGHGGTTDFSWFVFRRQTVNPSRIIRA